MSNSITRTVSWGDFYVYLLSICLTIFVTINSHALTCTELFAGHRDLSKDLTTAEVWQLIESEPASGSKIEIGAATSPLCPGCIQVDMYRSSFDMNKQNAHFYLKQYKEGDQLPKGIARETGGWLTDAQRLERLSRLTGVSPEKLLKPFAVNGPNGVIASANRLPFADNSVGILIKKNFPWFGPDASFFGYSGAKDYYRSFLREYRRILANDGVAILLFSRSRNPRKVMAFHAREARKLGFKVVFTRGEEFSGMVIGVVPSFNPSQRSVFSKVLDYVESVVEKVN